MDRSSDCGTASNPSRTINCVPAVGRTTPYTTAGILNFVFGEVWQRDGLSIRDRRLITLACVGLDDTINPIRSHVFSALKSGDITFDEMREVGTPLRRVFGMAEGVVSRPGRGRELESHPALR